MSGQDHLTAENAKNSEKEGTEPQFSLFRVFGVFRGNIFFGPLLPNSLTH
jgi:hypothetical protein